MYYWIDSRDKSEYKAYPLYGWIFPCHYCGSPTSKTKMYKIKEYPHTVSAQCCKNCKDKNFTFSNYLKLIFIS